VRPKADSPDSSGESGPAFPGRQAVVGWPWRTCQVQNSRNPCRCHWITVYGFTMTRADRQPTRTRQPSPEKSVGSGQLGSLHRALQHVELMAKSHVLQLECGSGFEDCRGRGCQNVKHMERGNGRFDEGRSNSMFSCSSGFTIDTVGSDSSKGRGRSALSFQEDVAAVICWQPLLYITKWPWTRIFWGAS
jgi:hypothetical protein